MYFAPLVAVSFTILFAVNTVCAAVAQQERNVACLKLQECVQITQKQVDECRQLLSQARSTEPPKQACENVLYDKQRQYLEKLSQKGSHFKACLANSGALNRVKRGGNRKAQRKNDQQCHINQLNGIRLKPLVSFGQTSAAPSKKQPPMARKMKQCMTAVQAAKRQCRPLQKCCPQAKGCEDELKRSPLHADLKRLQKELGQAKKTCKVERENGGQNQRKRKEHV